MHHYKSHKKSNVCFLVKWLLDDGFYREHYTKLLSS